MSLKEVTEKVKNLVEATQILASLAAIKTAWPAAIGKASSNSPAWVGIDKPITRIMPNGRRNQFQLGLWDAAFLPWFKANRGVWPARTTASSGQTLPMAKSS